MQELIEIDPSKTIKMVSMCINLRDLRLVGLRLIDNYGDYLINIIHNKDRLSLWSTLPIPAKHQIIGLKLAKKHGVIVKIGFILW